MLGTGGMGVIYLAEDTASNNAPCVVKHLSSTFSDPDEKAEAVRLFKREAALLQRLNHPGVVRFFDHYFTEDGKYYLVMDYVRGSSLETVITDFGPFNDDDTIKVGIQICEVLEYLHEQNPPIIYRDLKPSNLMLTPEGQIIFIDFGIARTFMPKESATRVVTAGYSPPEQYFGKPETRSDLYALGATIGHLLTGVRPKPLTTTTVSNNKPDVLPSLDKLVKELTAHSVEDRPVSARHVRHALYKCYQELHPEFEIPAEVFTDRSNTTKEEQFISQKIMKSGMAAAASALRREQDNERERLKAAAQGTYERLRRFSKDSAKDGKSSSSKNESVSTKSPGKSGEFRSTSARNPRATNPKNTNPRSTGGKAGRSSGTRPALKSVRDLKRDDRNFFEKIFGWFTDRMR